MKVTTEVLAKAKKIAADLNVSMVFINDQGEVFTQRSNAYLSVNQDKNRLAEINFNFIGDADKGNEYELTEADINKNPLLKESMFKPGDIIYLPAITLEKETPPEVSLYAELTIDQLRAELTKRSLKFAANSKEAKLIEKLEADDAEKVLAAQLVDFEITSEYLEQHPELTDKKVGDIIQVQKQEADTKE